MSSPWRGNRIQITLRGVMTVILAVMVIFVAERYSWRTDLSRERVNSLSRRGEEILGTLDGPLQVTLFFPDREPERSQLSHLLGACGAEHSGLAWEIVDPGQHPRRALAAGITEPGTVLLQYGERQSSFVVESDASGVYRLSEEQLVQAIFNLEDHQGRRVVVFQGAGFRSLAPGGKLSTLQKLLEFNNYEVIPWWGVDAPGGAVPAGTDLLIVPGPHRRLPPPVIAGFSTHLAAGGSLLILLDPRSEMADSSSVAGLGDLLAKRGIGTDSGFIVDLSDRNVNLDKGFEVPVVDQFSPHPMTRRLSRRSELVCMPMARGFSFLGDVDPAPLILAVSSGESFSERGALGGHLHFDSGVDKQGPLVMALLSESGTAGGGPLMVVGDSHFVSNEHIDWNGNADFLLAAVDWLGDKRDGVESGKPAMEQTLLAITRRGRRLYFGVSLLVLPLLTFIFWPLRILYQRRRSDTGEKR